jgi:hypothetical protein
MTVGQSDDFVYDFATFTPLSRLRRLLPNRSPVLVERKTRIEFLRECGIALLRRQAGCALL